MPANSAHTFSWKCVPPPAGCRPKKSFHCPTQMMTAMPEVKPTITGFGNELDDSAELREAHRQQDDAGHQGRDLQTVDAVLGGDAREHATNAPVGPEICTRVPPNRAVTTPATMAVYRPCSGFAPEAIANAIASGNATMPTTTPATTLPPVLSRLEEAGAVSFEQCDHEKPSAADPRPDCHHSCGFQLRSPASEGDCDHEHQQAQPLGHNRLERQVVSEVRRLHDECIAGQPLEHIFRRAADEDTLQPAARDGSHRLTMSAFSSPAARGRTAAGPPTSR